MTLAAPPPLPSGPAERVVRRVVFDHADWDFYQEMLRAVGDGPQRITYDRGRLEVEVPSQEHEQVKSLLRRLIEAFAEERGIDLLAFGSTTWGRRDLDAGLEPDESYYVGGSARAMEGRKVDLATDPPPDLAIEVDLSSPSVRKEPVYGRLGVAEVWRWEGGRLHCLHRQEDGRFVPAGDSTAMPGFPFDLAAELVERHAGRLDTAALKAIREHARRMD